MKSLQLRQAFTQSGCVEKARKNPQQLLPCDAGQMQVHVLNPVTLHLQASWQLPNTCTTAAISPNGCLLASAHHSQPLRNSHALNSTASDYKTETGHHGQYHEVSGHPKMQDSHGPTNVSFSMLLPVAQQVLKPVGVSDQGQDSMDIDIVSCNCCSCCHLTII